MPNIPTFQGYDQEQAPLPAASTPEAPASAAPGLGAAKGLAGLADEAQQVYQKEYERSVRESATAGVAKFQDAQTDILDQFGQLKGKEAIDAYAPTVARIRKLQQDTAQQTGNRDARNEVLNGTHSDLRIGFARLESQVAQQRKVLANDTTKFALQSSVKQLSSLAVAGANMDVIDKAMSDTEATLRKNADILGYEGEQADAYVASKLQIPAHALVTGLASTKSPLLKDALEKYGDRLEPSVQASMAKTLGAQEDANLVASASAALPHVDYSNLPNARGFIPDDAIIAAKADIADKAKDPAQAQRLQDALQKEADKQNADFNRAGAQDMNRILYLGDKLGPSGKFGIPESTPEWQEFKALHPDLADKLVDRAGGYVRSANRDARISEKAASAGTRGMFQVWLNEQPTDVIKRMPPEELASKMLQVNSHVDMGDVAKLQTKLAGMQKDKPNPQDKQIIQGARNALSGAFAGDRVNVEKNLGLAVAMYGDIQEANPAMKGPEIESKIAQVFAKNGFFGSRPGTSYVPQAQRPGTPQNAKAQADALTAKLSATQRAAALKNKAKAAAQPPAPAPAKSDGSDLSLPDVPKAPSKTGGELELPLPEN